MTPVTGIGRQTSTKNNPEADDMRNTMYNKIKQDEKRGKTKEDRVKQVKQNKAKKEMGVMKIIKK